MVALALVPAAAPAATGASARGCDPLDAKRCLLPWPNNAFTVSDVRTDTGRRMRLLPSQMPRNAKGRRIDPTDFNRADGFSPGSSILTYVPNLSLRKTGAVSVTNLRKALDRTQPIAVVNARTGARSLIWAEMDTTSRPGERLLIIHPAKNLSRGQRYIVALSKLKDSKGRLIKAPSSFRVFRDQLQTRSRVQERRRLSFEKNFATLAKAGIKRKDLYLAVGLHRREHAHHHRAVGRDPRQRVRDPRRQQPRRPAGEGRRAAVRARRAAGVRSLRRRRLPGRRERPARAQGHRHDDRAVLPRQEGLPSRLALPVRAPEEDRQLPGEPLRVRARSHQEQHDAGAVHVHRPARRAQQALTPRPLRPRAVQHPGRRPAS